MKNYVLKLIEYLYYLSLMTLLILYLFPGSLIGYLIYSDFGKQPNLISNPIGTSINHSIYFSWLIILVLVIRARKINFLTNINFIIFLSIILELLHFIIPNRAFEYYDLFANLLGVVIGFLIFKVVVWLKN